MPANGMGGRQQAVVRNLPAGYVVDEPNPQGEGTYKMVGPQGQTVLVPFSKVRGAEDSRYQLVGDPSDAKTDAGRYQRDAAAVAPSFLHSLESTFGVSPAQAKARRKEILEHPGKFSLEAAAGPAYELAKGLVG